MTGRRWLGLGLLTLATVVVCILLLTDWLPVLRGPIWLDSEWRWPYFLRPYQRWWLPILAAIVQLGVASWWLKAAGRGRRNTALGLLTLVGTSLLLQGSLVYADRPSVAAELVDRALAPQTSGYFRTASEIDEMDRLLAEYPAAMGHFDSEHARTHPPGLVLSNWLLIRALDKSTALSGWLADWIRPLRCTDLWLLQSPNNVLAALSISALLAPLMAALAIPLAYGLAREMADEAGTRLATVVVATLPALVLFAPLADQVLAFLGLATLLALFLAHRHRSTALYLVTGLLLSLASFASLGSLALLIVVAIVFAGAVWARADKKGDVLKWAGAMALGVVTVWIGYWLIWGVAPWTMAQTAMNQHYELVTSRRQYGIWLGFNLLDVLLFAGLAVAFGFVGAAFRAIRQPRKRWQTAAGSLSLGLALLIGLLLLSGTTRGEVGRIWLFFLPLVGVSAGIYLADRFPDWRAAALIVGLQLAMVVSLGLAWRPVEAVIVVAEAPTMAAPIMATPEGQMTELGAAFEEGIVLTGYGLTSREVKAGEQVKMSLIWRADGPTAVAYTVFAHVVNADGALIAQQDGWPVQEQWPPTCWRAGETIVDPIGIQIPDDAPPGDYALWVGLYNAGSGLRLKLLNGSDSVGLESIRIVADG